MLRRASSQSDQEHADVGANGRKFDALRLLLQWKKGAPQEKNATTRKAMGQNACL